MKYSDLVLPQLSGVIAALLHNFTEISAQM
jgi:hypothetical protein